MSGKGSKPRPYSVSADEFADRFDAIFGKKQMGSGVTGSAAVSNTAGPGSAPGSPATYVDNATGAKVSEDWWPGDTINQEQSA